MRYFFHVCVGWLCFVCVHAFAQKEPMIRVTPNQLIAFTDSNRVSAECHLSVNPSNEKHLLISVTTMNTKQDEDYTSSHFVSFDGGDSWQESLSYLTQSADPWGLILPNGTVLSSEICKGNQYILALKKSKDGGRSWSREHTVFDAGYDHSMLIYNSLRKEVYLVASRSLQKEQSDVPLLIARSNNNGKTFSFQKHHYPFKNVDINAKTPIIFSDGSFAIPFVVHGQYLENEKEITPFNQIGSWLIISKDGGKSFSPPFFITDMSGRRHNILAVNTYENFKDHLYYVFPAQDRKGLFFCKSENNGESWSKPKRIDQNPNAKAWNDIGAMVVNRKGTIGILYSEQYQVATSQCYQIYFTCSKDGGKSFEAPVKINESISCPDDANLWVAKAWAQGGDYYGLVTLSDGSFRAVWSDARQGKFRVYTSKILTD